MAIIKIVAAGRTKAALKAALYYICQPQKIILPDKQKLITAQNCWGSPKDIYETMIATKAMFRKDKDEINSEMYKHLQQSFQPGEATPQLIHEIGTKWADINFAQAGFEVCIATHIDKEHIHNHFIINSVNSLTGKTLEIHANKTLEHLKASSDELCRKHNLSVIERSAYTRAAKQPAYSMKKRYSVLNETFRQLSWQQQIYDTVKKALALSQGKGFEQFEQILNQSGVTVSYKRLRQDLIFTLNSVEKSISDRILEQTFPPKNPSQSILRANIEKFCGTIPKYEIAETEILSERKQGFYRLIENLIKVIDSATASNSRKMFMDQLQKNSWRLEHTPTGWAFYSESAKRYIYDSTIYKLTQDKAYCPTQLAEKFKKE